MAKKRKKDDLQVSLFPFLSILACVLGILTLMITAVVLSQANNETFQEKASEAMTDQTDFQETLEREKEDLTRLRKELAEAKKQPEKAIDPKKKIKLQQEIKRLKADEQKKLQDLRQDIAEDQKEKQEDAKELASVVEQMGNVDGQLETRKDPSKFATMVVKPSGSGLGGSVEPTFVECDAKGIKVFGAGSKKPFLIKRGEIAKSKKWLDTVKQVARDAPFRTWWSTAGSKIDAKFIKRDVGMVFLRKKGGGDLQVPASQLKERSKSVIRQIEKIRDRKGRQPRMIPATK